MAIDTASAAYRRLFADRIRVTLGSKKNDRTKPVVVFKWCPSSYYTRSPLPRTMCEIMLNKKSTTKTPNAI